jgi:hypothetical protein
MTSQKIIEKLQQMDWYVKCETEHELALVLNACLDADVYWADKKSAISLKYNIRVPTLIGRSANRWIDSLYFGSIYLTDGFLDNTQDITDWFFEELRSE